MSEQGIQAVLSKAIPLLRSNIPYGQRLANSWLPAATWVEALIKIGLIDASLVMDVRKFNSSITKSRLFGNSIQRFDGTNPTGFFRDDHSEGDVAQEVPPSNQVVQATEDGAPLASEDIDAHVSSLLRSYWPQSPEARQLFRPCSDPKFNGETPQQALERRIKILQSVQKSEDNWRLVVKGRDVDNICTKSEIFEIRQRALFLSVAYQLALKHMNQWTWHQSCKQTCLSLNEIGLMQATAFYKTITEWNITFRKYDCFLHPNLQVQCGKQPLPQLLEIYPKAKDQITSYCISNLASLTIEGVHEFIVSNVIPRLAKLWQVERANKQSSSATTGAIADDWDLDAASSCSVAQVLENDTHTFLKAHNLKSMSFTTSWRWMRLLGFRYCSRHKTFYADGHERQDVVADRVAFCKQYLIELEPYRRRWVQLPKAKTAMIKEVDVELGHCYFDIIKNEEWIEFQVDYWDHITKNMKKNIAQVSEGPVIQPSTSTRVSSNARPVMIVGQDESVF